MNPRAQKLTREARAAIDAHQTGVALVKVIEALEALAARPAKAPAAAKAAKAARPASDSATKKSVIL